MGRFPEFALMGRFPSRKSPGKQPIKKRGVKRFLILSFTPILIVRSGPVWRQDLAILSPEGPRDSTCQLLSRLKIATPDTNLELLQSLGPLGKMLSSGVEKLTRSSLKGF